MRVQISFGLVVMTLGLVMLLAVARGNSMPAAELFQFQQGKGRGEFKVDTGDYEVVQIGRSRCRTDQTV